MNVRKLLEILAITFLILVNINVSAVQAATVIEGGPSAVFVHSDLASGYVESANKIIADTSNPLLGRITSITLQGYVDNGASNNPMVYIYYLRYTGLTNYNKVTLTFPNSTVTTINSTVNSTVSEAQAWLRVYPSGSECYVYISSFTAINADGTEYVINYDPPQGYVNPDPPPDPDPDLDPDPTPDPDCGDTL